MSPFFGPLKPGDRLDAMGYPYSPGVTLITDAEWNRRRAARAAVNAPSVLTKNGVHAPKEDAQLALFS